MWQVTFFKILGKIQHISKHDLAAEAWCAGPQFLKSILKHWLGTYIYTETGFAVMITTV